ncbi:MAG: hypothetical protein HC825_11990 [Oscillatoriales cyanobacterium RM1_1_9]|nr:hypothetical protein [Oscillatoriales cyanobacterium SM2_3_0]NJO45848.1 hypothetical protein [Oscillatoriales cyanobacterium RM2_1_1]NJO72189.1 hypothetical protein [Oscillatoriales cyanobacterium RM1_1_9]
MEQKSLPTEVILAHPQQSLGLAVLDGSPQPGHYLNWDGQTYLVLERHHRYQLKFGRYSLAKISLYVQSACRPREYSFFGGRWVLGDSSCAYNARSEWVRCAINPQGCCSECLDYTPI